jgi:TonB dependent receptor
MLVLRVRLWLGGAVLGVVASSMICAAQTPGIAPENAGVEAPDAGVGVFAADRLAELPVDARQWESLELLGSEANAVTVAAGGSGDGEADLADGRGSGDGAPAAGVSYGGLSPVQNSATLDGLSMEQNFGSTLRGSGGRGASGSSGVGIGASFGQGAVRSFRVMPGTYSAAFGDAAGAVTAIRSRAGGEAWHGEGFGSVRSSALAAYNPFSVVTRYQNGVVTNFLVKPEDTLVQVGGHFGGPLGELFAGSKARVRKSGHGAPALVRELKMFASFEEQLRDDPAISSPAMASFYALTPMQVDLLGNRGVGAAATEVALNYLDSLTGTVARSSTRAVGFVRVDERVSRRDSLVGTYAGNRFALPAGTGFRSASNAVVNSGMASVGDQTVTMDAFAMHWLHAFTPGFTHVLRAQRAHDLEFDTPRAPLAQEPAISPGGFAPEVEIAPNGFSYGTPANLGRVAYPDERRVQVADEWEWVRGRNSFAAGFDWSRVDDSIVSFANPDGTFLYDSGVTGGHAGGLVDWITDYTFGVNAYPSGECRSALGATAHYFCFRSYTQSFGAAETEFVTHHLAGYVEDAFRVGRNLRLSIGVRYEYSLLPFPQTPNEVLDTDLKQVATQVVGATSSFPEDRNNMGPRVSVAWAPRSGRMVTAHLGYGIFYGRLAGTTVRSALTDTALAQTTLQVRIRPTTVTSCPQNLTMGFGFPCAYDGAPPAAVAETSSAMLFASNFRLPAVQRATLSLEREVGRRVLVRASYAGAIATQLPGSLDLNVAPSTAMASFVLQGG